MTAVTIFWLFYRVCLFCSGIVVKITELDATVIQLRGYRYTTLFNPPFSTFENACTKSGIWLLLSIRLMCFILWCCHLIRDAPFRIFLEDQWFYFLLIIIWKSYDKSLSSKCIVYVFYISIRGLMTFFSQYFTSDHYSVRLFSETLSCYWHLTVGFN